MSSLEAALDRVCVRRLIIMQMAATFPIGCAAAIYYQSCYAGRPATSPLLLFAIALIAYSLLLSDFILAIYYLWKSPYGAWILVEGPASGRPRLSVAAAVLLIGILPIGLHYASRWLYAIASDFLKSCR